MQIHCRTERLVLRRFTVDDVENVVALDADPEVMRYLTGGVPTPREVVRDEVLPAWLAYYARGDRFGYWAAQEAASGRFLGWFLFRPPREEGPRSDGTPRTGIELGYRLRRDAWGRGFATEGSRALIRRGFTEQGVERIYAETMAVNVGSRRVMEKSGLRFVGVFRQEWPEPIPGHEHGEVEYAVTKDEWWTAAGGHR